ncbi:hypothetical protein ACH49M_27975 [Rhodococcus qingshengii]|uniref:Uncharacterized protein n=1 Tax=Rhodococcus erythropolis TaxID=1833 RepID=A0A8I1D4Q2_RHOER|nr:MULTISPECIES: hypothetical protein [Rhodococcus]MBH5141136.1 hypothetical protein [Rhodococcus erythropolis]TSD39649.1 hypothetical protein FFI94_033135 [Rhodococcus sp. KBS0724]UGQ55205.1 hypothetical protein LRL17_30355 [Rhodococcus qingshengii]
MSAAQWALWLVMIVAVVATVGGAAVTGWERFRGYTPCSRSDRAQWCALAGAGVLSVTAGVSAASGVSPW